MNNLIETPQVIGYKLWHLEENWEIFSCNGLVEEDQAAYCNIYIGQWNYTINTPHKSPELNCTCGYYYAKSEEWLINYWSGHINPDKAIFELALYGKIIECEYGGRAEYFKVMRVILTERQLERMQLPWKYPVTVLEIPKKKYKSRSKEDWIKTYKKEEVTK